MTYISLVLVIEETTKKFARRAVAPGGMIVLVDDNGDAISYPYSRSKLTELCKAYYGNPECMIVVDPIVTGLPKVFERYAHQEVGFAIGAAWGANLKYKILYKLSYYRYYGLPTNSYSAAYAYCAANYPSLSMLYKFKNDIDADRACAAYLASRFMDEKKARSIRWHNDLQYILEELDDGTEECGLD